MRMATPVDRKGFQVLEWRAYRIRQLRTRRVPDRIADDPALGECGDARAAARGTGSRTHQMIDRFIAAA